MRMLFFIDFYLPTHLKQALILVGVLCGLSLGQSLPDPNNYSHGKDVFYSATGSMIVDTSGKGFHLSDPQTACVLFDVTGTGVPVCVSWPEPGSGNAWLVYDREGDGVIDSGKELFGNFTPHAAPDDVIRNRKVDPSGFLALGWYDRPAQGGNLDAMIDKRDKIWTKLKLWIDDHCYTTPDVPCSALPDELHPLKEFGITSISLVYTGANQYSDQYQNFFKFSAVLNPMAETRPTNEKGEQCCDLHQRSNDNRLIFDVYLRRRESKGSGQAAYLKNVDPLR